jgi:hypothetical protein
MRNINISRKQTLLWLIVINLIILYLMHKKFGFYEKEIKNLNEKLIKENLCANNFNNDIIELLTTATKLDVKLIIVEPQRLVQHLNEEELQLFIKSENSSVFGNNFRSNKIILGVFESNFSSSLTVR